MTVRVGINGFGRIGRNFFRAVAGVRAPTSRSSRVNDLTDNTTLAHLLKYDSILGRLADDVSCDRRRRSPSAARRSRSFAERDPADLPWGDLGADVVIESTGFFTDAAKAKAHIDARRQEGHHLRARPRTRTSPS